MSYEEFISDLPLEETIVFNSAEENEETMQRLGVNQQVRQSGKGNFQAHMAARSFDQLELFADRFSTAFSMYLEPPEGMVGFLLPRSVSGRFISSGENTAYTKMLYLPTGGGMDIVAPALSGSEAIGIPEERFIEMYETLCPTSNRPEELSIIEGNTSQLNKLRKAVLTLLAHPELDPGCEQITNLIAQIIAWTSDSSNHWESECFTVKRERTRIAKQAQEYIEENFRDTICIEDLCRITGVGVRTLQRCFKAYFELTVTEYLKNVRLHSAHRELLDTHHSLDTISNIALRNGFSHIGRFSVEYHERFNETPKMTHAT
jgi:AraC-like DNA-binding protein